MSGPVTDCPKLNFERAPQRHLLGRGCLFTKPNQASVLFGGLAARAIDGAAGTCGKARKEMPAVSQAFGCSWNPVHWSLENYPSTGIEHPQTGHCRCCWLYSLASGRAMIHDGPRGLIRKAYGAVSSSVPEARPRVQRHLQSTTVLTTVKIPSVVCPPRGQDRSWK